MDHGQRHDEEEEEEEEEQFRNYPRRHRRSMSDPHFEAYFSNQRGSSAKENDDSNASRNSNNNQDAQENDQDKHQLNHVDNEFKILMYLDEKNEADDDGPDHESGSKEKNMQVEKKLDFLFRQEVPLTDLYYDHDGQQSSGNKQPQAVSDNINSFFSTDMGRHWLTEN